MTPLRKLTATETASLEALGNSAEDWSKVLVSEDFQPFQLLQSHLEGNIAIDAGARIIRSRVANYHIGPDSLVEGVTALECRRRSSFGNGVGVATMNECGGRTVKIFDRLSAQTAYIMAVYRHRPQTIAALERMVDAYAEERSSEMGEVGARCRIVGARFIREVRIGDDVGIDGASILENATLCDGAHIGVDVKAYDFIAAESSVISNGSIVERCFIGESCRLDKGFTAAESLFFANSHCENGEAAAIFAGPYTVSHHKSSLLIAGMFSFFNAGSGSNQSNHLFKSGAVHQSVHLRGCKFSSDAYILLPASTGVFTIVKGRHYQHHDTDYMPFSYLIEERGDSYLLPAMNLRSYGTARDIRKWPGRDRRRGVASDLIRYELMTPYTAGKIIRAIHECEFLLARYPTAEEVTWNRVKIKTPALRKGLLLYTQALRGYLSELLEHGTVPGPGLAALPDDAPAGLATPPDGVIEWIDLAGLIVPSAAIDRLLDEVDAGRLAGFEILEQHLRKLDTEYSGMVASWAVYALEKLLKKSAVRITTGDLRQVIAQGEADRAALAAGVEMDARRDFAPLMAVGYGIDSEQYRDADFRAVRGDAIRVLKK